MFVTLLLQLLVYQHHIPEIVVSFPVSLEIYVAVRAWLRRWGHHRRWRKIVAFLQAWQITDRV